MTKKQKRQTGLQKKRTVTLEILNKAISTKKTVLIEYLHQEVADFTLLLKVLGSY